MGRKFPRSSEEDQYESDQDSNREMTPSLPADVVTMADIEVLVMMQQENFTYQRTTTQRILDIYAQLLQGNDRHREQNDKISSMIATMQAYVDKENGTTREEMKRLEGEIVSQIYLLMGRVQKLERAASVNLTQAHEDSHLAVSSLNQPGNPGDLPKLDGPFNETLDGPVVALNGTQPEDWDVPNQNSEGEDLRTKEQCSYCRKWLAKSYVRNHETYHCRAARPRSRPLTRMA